MGGECPPTHLPTSTRGQGAYREGGGLDGWGKRITGGVVVVVGSIHCTAHVPQVLPRPPSSCLNAPGGHHSPDLLTFTLMI